jgi:hypothetical protein
MSITINLRKAATLQTVLQEIIKTIDPKTSVKLTEFLDPAESIQLASQALFAQDLRRNDLLTAVYSLRTQIGMQNAASGVSARLTHMAYIDRRLVQLENMVETSSEILDMAVIQGRLDKIRNRPADGRDSYGMFGSRDEVETGVLTSEQIQNIRGVIRDLRKQKAQLNDEVMELNISTQIGIPPDIEEILLRENLI